jgi:general secretion pathway protein M
MTKADREVLASVGLLGLLLAVCTSAIGFSAQGRFAAAHELNARRDLLTRFEASVADRKNAQSKSREVAPPEAFLNAPTPGLAGAQLQSYLQHVANSQQATLISSGMETARHEDQPDAIRVQITFDASLQALQAVLYRLEGGTPYVFVDTLIVQLPGNGTQRAVEDPLLRITLGLRSLWRQKNA